VRPLGARVTVAAARPVTYTTTATLYMTADGDREALRLAALARLEAYQESRRRIGCEVPVSGRIAALHLTGEDGLPVLDEVDIAGDDVLPDHREIAVCSAIELTVVVR